MSPWDYWYDGLAGKLVETQPGHPRLGYWRNQMGTGAVAIFMTDGDVLAWEVVGDMRPIRDRDELDERFSFCCRYPIPYELFDALREGKPLPPEYRTRLTLEELKDGTPWTPALGRAKLGLDLAPKQNLTSMPSAAALASGIIESLATAAKAAAPSMPIDDPPSALFTKIQTAALELDRFVEEIDGVPRDKPQADKIANFATLFGAYKKEALSAHQLEKAEPLRLCKEIDAKWFALSERAEKMRSACLASLSGYLDAKEAENIAAANATNEKIAEQYRDVGLNVPPPQVAPERVSVGNVRKVGLRKKTTYVITDIQAFSAYLAAMPTPLNDFVVALQKIANSLGRAGVIVPGVEKEEGQRVQ